MIQFFQKSLQQGLRVAAVISLFCGLTLNHVAAGETDLDRRSDSCILTGRVVLGESVSALRPLIEAQAAVRDAEVCSAEAIPDERLVFNSTTLQVKNAFVWLESSESLRAAAEQSPEKLEPKLWTFEGCRFRPHAICLRARQILQVQNKDSVVHLPHDYPIRNSVACSLLPATEGPTPTTIQQQYPNRESIPISFTCDYHPWMQGYALVQDHPFMAVTDEQGHFEIQGVPRGSHKLIVWHELRGYLLRTDMDFDQEQIDIGRVEFQLTAEEKKTLGLTD